MPLRHVDCFELGSQEPTDSVKTLNCLKESINLPSCKKKKPTLIKETSIRKNVCTRKRDTIIENIFQKGQTSSTTHFLLSLYWELPPPHLDTPNASPFPYLKMLYKYQSSGHI